MEEKLEILKSKLETLLKSNFMTFNEVAALKDRMGVYLIYEDEKIIYIGKTNKFHIRFGTDLKHESTHTLVGKLIKSERFEDRYQVLDYFKTKCRIRIEFCETNREAEALEGIAIYLLEPELNKL
ncbi:MAG: hypothetical protein K1X92_01455 [Bacteroidia bacterium]|nr:hypothetical protein [Bacteroidia bacterium]